MPRKTSIPAAEVPQAAPDAARLEADLASVMATVQPPSLPTTRPPEEVARPTWTGTKKIWSRKETMAQLQMVQDWRIDGFDKRQVERAMKEKYPGMTRGRVHVLWARITRVFEDRAHKSLVERKEEALARLRRAAAVAWMGEKDPADAKGKTWRHKPSLANVLAFEQLIAKIEGTLAPVQVNVDQTVTLAMIQVVQQLSGDDASDYLAEAMEQGRLAEAARKEHLLLPETASASEAPIHRGSAGGEGE